jgi:hypothetical protein
MRFLLLGLAILVATPAFARIHCSETQRFGQHLVRVGDSERRVIQAAGQPDQQRQLENRRGGAAGFRFDYYQRGQTVQVYIAAGVVTRICRIRE